MDSIIRNIIHTRLGDIDISDEQSLEVWGADDIDFMELTVAIEEALNIAMDDDALDEADTILDFINIAKESPSNVIH